MSRSGPKGHQRINQRINTYCFLVSCLQMVCLRSSTEDYYVISRNTTVTD